MICFCILPLFYDTQELYLHCSCLVHVYPIFMTCLIHSGFMFIGNKRRKFYGHLSLQNTFFRKLLFAVKSSFYFQKSLTSTIGAASTQCGAWSN